MDLDKISKKAIIYSPEFRQQMVELHKMSYSFNQLASEFGCGGSTVAPWIKVAGQKPIGPVSLGSINQAQREELVLFTQAS